MVIPKKKRFLFFNKQKWFWNVHSISALCWGIYFQNISAYEIFLRFFYSNRKILIWIQLNHIWNYENSFSDGDSSMALLHNKNHWIGWHGEQKFCNDSKKLTDNFLRFFLFWGKKRIKCHFFICIIILWCQFVDGSVPNSYQVIIITTYLIINQFVISLFQKNFIIATIMIWKNYNI